MNLPNPGQLLKRHGLLIILVSIGLAYIAANGFLFHHAKLIEFPDTRQYVRMADEMPVFGTTFWSDFRPKTTPLIFKSFENDFEQIVRFQMVLGVFGWLLLATAAALNTKHPAAKIGGFASILILGSGIDFVIAYKVLITEGVAYTLLVWVVAEWLLAIWVIQRWPELSRGRQVGIALVMIVTMLFWSLARYPNALLMLGMGGFLILLLVLAALFRRPLGAWRLILPLVGIAAVVAFFAQSISVSQSDYWKQNMMNVLAEKVLPYEERTQFFAARNMPTSEQAMSFAGYVPARYHGDWESVFGNWMESEGRSVFYRDYLLLRPLPRLREILDHREQIFSPEVLVGWYSRGSAEGDLNQWQQDTHYLYYDPSAIAYFLAGVLGVVLLASLYFQDRKNAILSRFLPALVLLALMFPSAASNWYGDLYDERMYIGVSMMSKLGALLLVIYGIDAVLTHRKHGTLVSFVQSFAIALIIGLGLIEVFAGVGALRNRVTYPIVSAALPDTNVLRFWGVSDLEYRVYQHAPIGEPVMSLQYFLGDDGSVYAREFIVYWSESGAHGELYERDGTLEMAWRASPVPISVSGPKGRVFGGFKLDQERNVLHLAWQDARLPGHLRGAGIEYVHVDTRLWAHLPGFQTRLIQNDTLYELVDVWHTEHLYRVVSELDAWNLPAASSPDTLGLSPTVYEQYQSYTDQIELLEPGAVIFNPMTGETATREYEITTLASTIAYTQPAPSTLNRLFELLFVMEQMQYQDDIAADDAITTWRNDKMPQHLREQGIDYLFFEETWASWLSTEESAILNNPDHYERIRVWQWDTQGTYLLYRVG